MVLCCCCVLVLLLLSASCWVLLLLSIAIVVVTYCCLVEFDVVGDVCYCTLSLQRLFLLYVVRLLGDMCCCCWVLYSHTTCSHLMLPYGCWTLRWWLLRYCCHDVPVALLFPLTTPLLLSLRYCRCWLRPCHRYVVVVVVVVVWWCNVVVWLLTLLVMLNIVTLVVGVVFLLASLGDDYRVMMWWPTLFLLLVRVLFDCVILFDVGMLLLLLLFPLITIVVYCCYSLFLLFIHLLHLFVVVRSFYCCIYRCFCLFALLVLAICSLLLFTIVVDVICCSLLLRYCCYAVITLMVSLFGCALYSLFGLYWVHCLHCCLCLTLLLLFIRCSPLIVRYLPLLLFIPFDRDYDCYVVLATLLLLFAGILVVDDVVSLCMLLYCCRWRCSIAIRCRCCSDWRSLFIRCCYVVVAVVVV